MAWPTSLLFVTLLAIAGVGYEKWEGRVRSLPDTSRIDMFTIVILAATFVLLCTTRLSLPSTSVLVLLVLASNIDVHHQMIPNRLLLATVVFGLLTKNLIFVVPAIAIAATLLGINWMYQRIRGQPPLGAGDIKLLAVTAGFIGWPTVGLIYIASVGIVLVAIGRYMAGHHRVLQHRVPFAPFLAIAFILGLLLEKHSWLPWQ